MSSQSARSLPWQWEPSVGRFVYIPSTDSLVLDDGRRVPRPSFLSRSSPILQAAAYTGPVPLSEVVYEQNTGRVPNPSPQSMRQPASTLPQGRRNIDSYSQTGGLSSEFGRLSMNITSARPPPTAQGTEARVAGERMITDIVNPTTMVHTTFQTFPPEEITDGSLLQKGISARSMLIGTPGDAETLFQDYTLRKAPSKFFIVGRVFRVLWSEPAGDNNTAVSGQERSTTIGRYDQRVFSKVRTFVVIRSGATYCSALPISTYGNQGVAKRGVKRSEHAIIYSGRKAPDPLPEEMSRGNGDESLRSIPIRVVLDLPNDKLDPISRLDFGKVHTIQHNIRVRPVGLIHNRSMEPLISQFSLVWRKEPATSSKNPAYAAQRGESSTTTVESSSPSYEPRTQPQQVREGPGQPSEQSTGSNRGSLSPPQYEARLANLRSALIAKGYSGEQIEQLIQKYLQDILQKVAPEQGKGKQPATGRPDFRDPRAIQDQRPPAPQRSVSGDSESGPGLRADLVSPQSSEYGDDNDSE